MRPLVFYVLAFVALAGCKKESANGPTLGGELDKVERTLESVSPPKAMPVLKWNFDRPKTIAYDYRQRIEVTDSDKMNPSVEGAGLFVVTPTSAKKTSKWKCSGRRARAASM